MCHSASTGRTLGACLFVVLALHGSRASRAAIINITGSSSASVTLFEYGSPIQDDFEQAIVPQTVALPPALSRARLEHVLQDGHIDAAGQVVALFDQPDFFGAGSPNDVGLDLGAFSDVESLTWDVSGSVQETRTLVFGPGEIGGDLFFGGLTQLDSTLFLSGILLVTSIDPSSDLTGVEARLSLKLAQHLPGQPSVLLVEGEVILSGGPNGTASISLATGVFANVPLVVSDFSLTLDNLPVAWALPFPGLEFPYQYDFVENEPFDLDLTVTCQVHTHAGGSGASAVFGLPPAALGAVLAKVKEDDRGLQLMDAITQHVDTTGVSYIGTGGSAFPFSIFFPACGFLGIESAGFLFLFVCLGGSRRVLRAGKVRRAVGRRVVHGD